MALFIILCNFVKLVAARISAGRMGRSLISIVAGDVPNMKTFVIYEKNSEPIIDAAITNHHYGSA